MRPRSKSASMAFCAILLVTTGSIQAAPSNLERLSEEAGVLALHSHRPSGPSGVVARHDRLVFEAAGGGNHQLALDPELPAAYAYSADGRFFGLSESLRSGLEPGQEGEERFRLFTNDGRLLWQEEVRVPWDGHAPRYAVSTQGVTARLSVDDGELAFLDPRGHLLARHQASFPSDLGQRGVWSSSGERYALLATEPRSSVPKPPRDRRRHIPGEHPGSRLELFDAEGTSLWRASLDKTGRDLLFTPRGDALLVGHYRLGPTFLSGATLFGTASAEALWTVEGDLVTQFAAFSGGGERLLLTTGSRAPAAVVIETTHGEVLREHPVAKPIHSALLDPVEGNLHLLSGHITRPRRGGPAARPAITDIELLTFGADGEELGAADLSELEAAPQRLRLVPGSTAGLLTIQANDRVVHYRLGARDEERER